MKKVLIALLGSIALAACASPASAQTQTGVIPGFMAAAGTDGCPTTRACFVPYSATYPLPTTGGGVGSDVNLTGINGVAPSVGSGLTGTGSPRVTQSSAAPTSSSALAANTIVCGSACRLSSFNVGADSTLSGAAWWIMIYNATSAPADGAVTPIKCYPMASGSTGIAAAFPVPLNLTTGAVIGVSTTGCFSKTASTHAFISGDAQ